MIYDCLQWKFTRKITRSYAQQQLILSVTKVKTQQEMLIKKQDNQKNKQKRNDLKQQPSKLFNCV